MSSKARCVDSPLLVSCRHETSTRIAIDKIFHHVCILITLHRRYFESCNIAVMQLINVRKSNVEIGKLYFWTATINNWYKLLQEDALKEIIISSLRHLSIERKIKVYAFVLMP